MKQKDRQRQTETEGQTYRRTVDRQSQKHRRIDIHTNRYMYVYTHMHISEDIDRDRDRQRQRQIDRETKREIGTFGYLKWTIDKFPQHNRRIKRKEKPTAETMILCNATHEQKTHLCSGQYTQPSS